MCFRSHIARAYETGSKARYPCIRKSLRIKGRILSSWQIRKLSRVESTPGGEELSREEDKRRCRRCRQACLSKKRFDWCQFEIEGFLSRAQEDKEWHIDMSSIIVQTACSRRVRGRSGLPLFRQVRLVFVRRGIEGGGQLDVS